MSARTRRALLFFGFVFVVFGFLITYLMVLTPGLVFEKKEGRLYLKNASLHRIEAITIEDEEGERLACIGNLDAGQARRIELPPRRQPLVLTAAAPFHAPATTHITPLDTGLVALDYNLYRPAEVYQGERFELELRLCGKGIDFPWISVEEQHDPAFFRNPPRTRVLAIRGKQCKSLFYSYHPKKSGVTEIVFRLEATGIRAAIKERFKVRALG